MRLNKKKLAALAMSAVMAASTMPFPVMAEEEGFTDFAEFTDEGETTVAEAEKSATTDAPARENLEVDLSAALDENGKIVATAEWKTTDANGKEVVNTTTNVDITHTYEADCTNAIRVDLSVWINNYEYTAEGVVVDGSEMAEHVWGENPDKVVKKSATCTDDGVMYVTKKCTKCGATTTTEEDIPALGHDWKVTKTEYVLSNQNQTDNKIPAYFDYAAMQNVKVVRDANGVAVPDEAGNYQIVYGTDGKPQADDPTREVFYFVKTSKKCNRCSKEAEPSYDQVNISGDQVTGYKVVSTDNIASGVGDTIDATTLKKLINKDKTAVNAIELKDCTKDGTIVVENRVGNSSAGRQTITIDAHHYVVTVYEAASKEDAALLREVTINGKTTIVNDSCYKDITYYEVQYCTAVTGTDRNCGLTEKYNSKKYQPISTETAAASTWRVYSRTPVKVAHTGSHSYESAIKTQINNLVADTTKTWAVNGVLTRVGVNKLADLTKNNKYIKVSKDTATCTENGKITIEFICRVCDQTVDTVTVKTAKLGHDFQELIDKATVVEATCENRGYYETADLCTRCGVESDTSVRKAYYESRLAHTNEADVLSSGVGMYGDEDTALADAKVESYIAFTGDKVVDYNGANLKLVGKEYAVTDWFGTVDGAMSATLYTNCSICHNNPHALTKVVTIKVADIQKESVSGAAGYIKLEASYKVNDKKTVTAETTVPYFSTLGAYLGRTETDVIDGLHTDKDGITRYYEDGKFVEKSGIIKYAGKEYLVDKGVLCENTHGVTLVEGTDTFYFLANGCVQRGYTGVTIYDGQSFYLNNGVVDTDINGLVPYNGGTFLFAAGRLVKEHNGLWQDFDGTWYFLALGQVQTQYTGVAEYDGAYFYVKNGKLDTTKNGTITVDGVKYTAVDGQLYK